MPTPLTGCPETPPGTTSARIPPIPLNFDEFEAEHRKISNGRCRNRYASRGVYREPWTSLHRSPSLSRRIIASSRTMTMAINISETAAERPITRSGELVLHQVADHDRFPAAQQIRCQVRAPDTG